MPSLFVSQSLNIRFSALTQEGFNTWMWGKLSESKECDIINSHDLESRKEELWDVGQPFVQNRTLLKRSRAFWRNTPHKSLLPR
jgi:hypothetical protein